jgi:hypothetical protein
MPRLGLILALLVVVDAAKAQTLTGAQHYALLSDARAALDQRRFPEAMDLYRLLAQNNPRDGDLWMGYAAAAQGAGKTSEMIAGAEKMIELGTGFRPGASVKAMSPVDRPYVAYLIARGYASLGRKTQALDWLDRALAWRYTPRTNLQADTSFRAFLDDDRFRRIAGFPPRGSASREERWRYDIDWLVAEAKRVHASPSREAFSAEFENAARDLESRINQLSDRQLVVGLNKLLVLLKDGHTGVVPPEGSRLLPLDLYWFSDGLFVVNGSGDAKLWTGSRVLKFGTRDVDAVLQDLPAYVPRDNPIGLKRTAGAWLRVLDYLEAMGTGADSLRASLTLQDRHGAVQQVSFDGIVDEPRPNLPPAFGDTARAPLFLKRARSNYWFAKLPESNAVYFQFNAVGNQPGETIAQFAPKLAAVVQEPAVRTLIVDVRHNGGGNSYLYPPLVRAIAAFQDLGPDRRIFVLTSRHTFSAAQNFVTLIDRLTNAIFAGEPTGSSPKFTGESPPRFRIPYSGVRASISNWYHQFTFWSDTRIWIAPDVPVELSATDYFAGRDPVLEAVMQIINRNPTGS